MNIKQLMKKANEIRAEILRMTTAAGSGHPGGSLSAADLVVALYFGGILNHNPKEPNWKNRDRFILSKGHCVPLLYAILADRGYFPKEELKNLRKLGSILQGHPDRLKTPGVEATTGSLGQGLGVGVGIALAGKLDKKDYNVYVMLGDGECQEGNVWESAMAAGHYKLNNLIAIVDYNGLQIDGKVEEVMNIQPIADKFKAFNWNVLEIDGHKYNEIFNAFEKAANGKNKPTAIIAKTIKGKGISFMENQVDFHGRALTKEEFEKARKELGA